MADSRTLSEPGSPLRALTVQQPLAYLAGCLAGDAYLSPADRNSLVLGLHVKDEDFAQAFGAAIEAAFSVRARVHREADGYWRTRIQRLGLFESLRNYKLPHQPASPERDSAWIRGFFDSEGNACLVKLPRGRCSQARRVSFYNTDPATVARLQELLSSLGFPCRSRLVKASAGHYGRRPVIEVVLASGQDSYARFADEIGSSIQRKQATLDALATSYSEDLSADRRAGQLSGAATRRARASDVRLPMLLGAISAHVAAGGKETYQQLGQLDGYWSARKTLSLTHAELIEMAFKGGKT